MIPGSLTGLSYFPIRPGCPPGFRLDFLPDGFELFRWESDEGGLLERVLFASSSGMGIVTTIQRKASFGE